MARQLNRREFLAGTFGTAVCINYCGAEETGAPSQGSASQLPLYEFLLAVETSLRQLEAGWHPSDHRGKAAFFQRAMAEMPDLCSRHLQHTVRDRRRVLRFNPIGAGEHPMR